jgi:FixJ family two-component response regulator
LTHKAIFAILSSAKNKGLAGFIQKPYRSAKLLIKVREALE